MLLLGLKIWPSLNEISKTVIILLYTFNYYKQARNSTIDFAWAALNVALNNKQLLDEVEYDMKNYAKWGGA